MTVPIALTIPDSSLVTKDHLDAQVQHYLQNALSPRTRKAYSTDWQIFQTWCKQQQVTPLPAEPKDIARFLAMQSEDNIAASSLSRRLAAIRYIHEACHFPNPCQDKLVTQVMKGIRRGHGGAKQKKPVTIEILHHMLAFCQGDNLRIKRDRALLALGFCGAFRRSELAALAVEDLEFNNQGLKIHIRQSKSDQEGQGQIVAIPHGYRLPVVRYLQDWLEASCITDGHVFRSIARGDKTMRGSLQPLAIANLVKKYALQAGYDPALFSAHSLRAGFLTSAAENGANIFKMMEVSRHKKIETLRVYVRSAEMFKDHAGAKFI